MVEANGKDAGDLDTLKTQMRTGTGRNHKTTRNADKARSSRRANTTSAELSGVKRLEEDRCDDGPGYVLENQQLYNNLIKIMMKKYTVTE